MGVVLIAKISLREDFHYRTREGQGRGFGLVKLDIYHVMCPEEYYHFQVILGKYASSVYTVFVCTEDLHMLLNNSF